MTDRVFPFVIFLLLVATSSHGLAEDSSDFDCPNVLFIAIDDLNDWVGFPGGHPQALTPNMDRLAKRGIVFTNAHRTSPACNPSRAAIFSGKFPEIPTSDQTEVERSLRDILMRSDRRHDAHGNDRRLSVSMKRACNNPFT